MTSLSIDRIWKNNYNTSVLKKGACEILRRIIGKRVKVPYGPAAVSAEQGSMEHWETGKKEPFAFDA